MNTLPNTFQQVEYIESSGTQYIDTGINPNFNIKVEFDFISTGTTNTGFLYGSRTTNSTKCHTCILFFSEKDWYPQFANNTSVVHLTDTYPELAQNGVRYKIENSKDGFYINDTLIKTYNETSFESIYTMYIFGLNKNGSLETDQYRRTKCKLYNFKIYDNGTLVRDFIPCYRKSDNEIGLYDVINNVFYTNNGTGTFIKGNNVTVADKLSYLRETKEQIKNRINFLTGELTDETPFREYTNALDKLYSELPKTSQDGTSITLANTRRGKITITPKGNTSQKNYEGKNLCPTNLLPITANGLTISKDANGNIIINGTPNYSSGYKTFIIGTNRIIPVGKYSISVNTKLDGIGFANGVPYAELSMSETVRTKTTTTSEEATITPKINIRYDVGTLNNFKLNPQVEVGNPTDYEPYTGGTPSPNPDYPQDIKVVTGDNNIIVRGKNLSEIDRNDSTNPMTRSGLTYTFNKNAITVIGTRTATTGVTYIFKKRFKPGTYTISGLPNKEIGSSDRGTVYIWYDTVPNAGLSNPDITKTQIFANTTLTLEQDGYIGFRIISQGDAVGESLIYNQTYNIQIEEGSTATEYEPYIEPITKQLNLENIELAKNGDYSDLIFKNEKSNPYYNNALVENGWYEKQIVNSRLYNGTENFQLGSASTNDYYIFQTAYKDDLADSKEGGELVCDNFVFNRTEGNYQKEYLSLNANAYTYVRFHISASRLSEKSVNAFKNWLETHNVLIHYVLENPIYTQITDATLINQLEEINKVIGQGGTVIVETESEEENAQLIVNASALASFENS